MTSTTKLDEQLVEEHLLIWVVMDKVMKKEVVSLRHYQFMQCTKLIYSKCKIIGLDGLDTISNLVGILLIKCEY